MPGLRLYHYWRSSSSWRIRWALDLKQVPCELVAVSLLDGESESPEHRARSPLGYVPVLQTPDGYLSQSPAILYWLEETFPASPSLFPEDPWDHARCLQLADIICSDTQPIQNVNVLQLHSADPHEQKKWAQHFIRQGLSAFEKLASSTSGRYSIGDSLTWADLCLMPQLYNANRYEVQASEFPLLSKIAARCETLPSYLSSHPSRHEPGKS
jgi:maleylacetoacetate isomerase